MKLTAQQRNRARALGLLVWLALTVAGFGLAAQNWFVASFLLDEMPKTLAIAGSQAFPSMSAFLWLTLASALVAAFTPKAVARVIAFLMGMLSAYASFAFSLLFSSGTPTTVTDLVSKASGLRDNFELQGSSYPTIFSILIGCLAAVQLIQAFLIHVSVSTPRNAKYERTAKSKGSDPISLWDSQA